MCVYTQLLYMFLLTHIYGRLYDLHTRRKRKRNSYIFCGMVRGITQLLFLSMHNASLMTYPAGSQLNGVLFVRMARDNAEDPSRTRPHPVAVICLI